jgi:hypothetical protein
MRNNSLVSQHICLIEAGLLSCQALMPYGAFRPRTLRFFIDLFTNWQMPDLNFTEVGFSNTQIIRHLEELVKKRHSQKINKKKKIYYTLTDSGLVNVAQKLASRDYSKHFNDCLFVKYFLQTYLVPYLKNYIKKGSKKKLTLTNQILTLVDTGLFVQTQSYYIEESIKVINRQIERVYALQKELSEVDINIENFREVTENFEFDGQYSIHKNYKINKLLGLGGEERLIWEMKYGSLERIELLYKPEIVRLELLKKTITS